MKTLRMFLRLLRQGLCLMVGVGDYEAYVQHMHNSHPDLPVMSKQHWFRSRQDARYGVAKDGVIKRCPC